MAKTMAILRREGPIGIPADADFGYGTNIVPAAGGDSCLFSWIEGGAAYRLGSWFLRDGSLEVLPTIGTLRSAAWDASERRGYVVTQYGLHAISIDPLRSLKKIKSGLPKFPTAILPIPNTDDFIVGAHRGKTCVRVSLTGPGSAERLAIPTPSLLVEDGNEIVALSFAVGAGVMLGQRARKFDLPRAVDAIVHRDKVWIALGRVTSPTGPSELESSGELATWSRDGEPRCNSSSSSQGWPSSERPKAACSWCGPRRRSSGSIRPRTKSSGRRPFPRWPIRAALPAT